MKHSFFRMGTAVSAVALVVGLVGGTVNATPNNNVNDKITICHSTQPNPSQGGGGGPQNNPYVQLSVDTNAADGNAGNQQGQGDHFAEHNGPLFNNTNQDYWGDIIPPILGVHSGLNWTAGGQAIYNNDCEFTTPDGPATYFQFAKKWTGAPIDLTNVKVTFYIGQISWELGDAPVEVMPGDELSPLSETVSGLPSNCTYTSDLPGSYTIPNVMNLQNRLVDQIDMIDDTTYTLTATNTVTCEAGRGGEPVVTQVASAAAATNSEPQVSVAPVGGVNAGGGSAPASAIIGLVTSVSLLAAGLNLRKFTL